MTAKITNSKYTKTIRSESIDVYDVLKAFNVTNPALQHAVKKLLMPGIRGDKSIDKDLDEAIQSIVRARELIKEDHGSMRYTGLPDSDHFIDALKYTIQPPFRNNFQNLDDDIPLRDSKDGK